jgi:5'-nucleotidase
MNRNCHHWFTTCSGLKFYPTAPKASEVKIRDIAHALALVCRFGGHVKEPYSVAQHSVLVSRQLCNYEPTNTLLQMYGLLHDASEAYIGDMVRPLKVQMPLFLEIEERLMKVIYKAFKLPKLSEREERLLKRADNELLLAERRDILVYTTHRWHIPEKPAAVDIDPWNWVRAESEFMQRYKFLKKELKK